MNLRRVLLSSLMFSLALSLSFFACSPSQQKPSVLFVMLDTLRLDYLGFGGYPGPVSPQLDAFAKDSHLFLRCYSQAPWTKPSVASAMTSLYPTGHGLTNHEGLMWSSGAEEQLKGVLSAEANTLAETFLGNGYETAAVVSNPWITKEYGFDQGFESWEQVVQESPAASLLDRARKWLGKRPRDRPFFMYLHLMDVHGPYNAPDSCYAQVQLPETEYNLRSVNLERVPEYLRQVPWLEDKGDHIGEWKSRYAAGVRYVDAELGRFLTELGESGDLDNMIVVIGSDHGESLAEHNFWGHGYGLYDHQIRVPLILRLPETEEQRSGVHQDIVRVVDIFPTILHYAGIPAPDGLDGANLGEALEGAGELPGVSYAHATLERPAQASICVDRYKL
ncbi:MAG: sulfatase, partial [Candidatus Eisenbacteria bacterium]|nr:sulfatase [Candidatus Eisenbacteria bacterium]